MVVISACPPMIVQRSIECESNATRVREKSAFSSPVIHLERDDSGIFVVALKVTAASLPVSDGKGGKRSKQVQRHVRALA